MSSLAQLTLQAQQRCDRVNATTITAGEWTTMVNASVQELYGTLCSTYEDYNVKSVTFTLPGGDPPLNQIALGEANVPAGYPTSLPQITDFYLMRALWWQASPAPSTRWVPLLKCAGFLERHRFLGPNVSLYYGSTPSAFLLYGTVLEVLPPASSGGTYMLLYVPQMPQLVGPNEDIAPYWLSVNGWDEYIVLDVAAKALIKEESIESANILLQQKQAVLQRVLKEAAPRDDGQPGMIQDVQRAQQWDLNGYGGRQGGWW